MESDAAGRTSGDRRVKASTMRFHVRLSVSPFSGRPFCRWNAETARVVSGP